jgi:DNA processing protein
VITSASASYPRQLREIHSAPIVLYVWGELTDRDQHAIGVIGSRRTTHYGTESAKKLSYQLAYAGLTVISGLARGIDTAAHQGALAAKGRTIAVIGSGLMKLYPPENAALAEKIRSGNGAIVSEFSMEIEPDRQTFPMRNRIISGWSHGILVVEAGLNSGALITASQAIDQGRSVYAVPGHINAPSAQGSNRLIQQGAKLVMDASDILDDLQVLLPETKPSPEAAARPLPELTDDERRVYEAIEATETPIDEISTKCGLPSANVSSTQAMPLAIATFREAHPDVSLTLAEGEPEEIAPRLRAGEFDLALLFEFPDEEWSWYPGMPVAGRPCTLPG